MNDKSFFTTHEAAALLKVTPRTVQLWCESGVLAFQKTQGGHRRIPRDAVERLISAGEPLPTHRDVVPVPLRVMVVEDELSLLRLYRVRLSAWPLKPIVTTVDNGFEALVRIGAERPDLLITDLHMPEWDGFQMLRTIRGIHELDRMEIVVVTGLDDAAIAERGGLPEDMTVLGKPVPFEKLERYANALARSLGRLNAAD